MTLPRISIRKLMAYVAVIAVGIAALANPNTGWAVLFSAIFVTMLLTSILGVILCRGTKQAYWLGFGLFGWASYLTGSVMIFESLPGGSSPSISWVFLYFFV